MKPSCDHFTDSRLNRKTSVTETSLSKSFVIRIRISIKDKLRHHVHWRNHASGEQLWVLSVEISWCNTSNKLRTVYCQTNAKNRAIDIYMSTQLAPKPPWLLRYLIPVDINSQRDDAAVCRRRAIRPNFKKNLWELHTRWSIKMSFCPSAVNVKVTQSVISSTDVSSAFLMFLLLPSSVATPVLRRSQIEPRQSDIYWYLVSTISSENSNNIARTVRGNRNCKAGSQSVPTTNRFLLPY